MKRTLGVIWLMVAGMLGNAQAATTKMYFIHSDHLGTPQVLTDQEQTVVWRAEHQPFGEVVVDEDPDGDGVKVTMPLRFPGQYADPETGLNYNYYRDYDPATGRYLQSDPIGINYDFSDPQFKMAVNLGIRLYPGNGNLGLNNLYGYSNQNPLNYVDSFGLWPSTCGPGHIFCNFPELAGQVTKQSLSHAFKNSRLIASRRDIKKVDELCKKFGGKPRDWKKKAGVDDKGREWHWYEKKGGEKYGLKPNGAHDPF